MTNETAFKWAGLDYIVGEGPSEGWNCPICGATHGRLEATFRGRGVPNNFWERWEIECFDCRQHISLTIRPQEGDTWLTDFRRKTNDE